jgi:hypothetical protein
LHNKWTYETDNQFAVDVLSSSFAKHQSVPNPSIRCCTECSNLLYRGKSRAISTLGLDSSCGLCQWLLDISADPDAQRWKGTHIELKGSALVLDEQRILALRSESGEWVYSAFLDRLISVPLYIRPSNAISLSQYLGRHSDWIWNSATSAQSKLFYPPSNMA